MLALLVIMLVQRNSAVSPWFALVTLSHAIVETLLTVIRRLALHQTSIGEPDNFHLHSLLYQRLLNKYHSHLGKFARRLCNVIAASVLLVPNAVMAALAIRHYQETSWLMAQFSLFTILFVLIWSSLMRHTQPNLRLT